MATDTPTQSLDSNPSGVATAELEKPNTLQNQTKVIDKVLLVGLDLGTNTTCLEFANVENSETELSELIPSLVGYARSGILPGVIPGKETTLFGTDALKYKLHLKLVQPLEDGIIEDMDAVRDYLVHLKAKTNSDENTEIRAVIVKADPDKISNLLQNIIITGGGGMISGINQALEDLLAAEGFEGCKVAFLGETFKTCVATGALVAARQGDRQWQTLLR